MAIFHILIDEQVRSKVEVEAETVAEALKLAGAKYTKAPNDYFVEVSSRDLEIWNQTTLLWDTVEKEENELQIFESAME